MEPKDAGDEIRDQRGFAATEMKMMPAGVVGGADCEDYSSAEPVDASDKEDGFADEQFYSFRYQVNHSN